MTWRWGAELFLFGFLILCQLTGLHGKEKCDYRYQQTPQSVEVFWINMDRSLHRRVSMENHLNEMGILHRRVRGLSVDEIYFPTDIKETWNQYEAQIETKERIPQTFQNQNNHTIAFTHVMSGLVGRQKSNRMKEVGCTASHLEAMRVAIFENRTSSPYALITEDDVFFPFNIDFDALVASAPADFAILQLFNSNEDSMRHLWGNFLQRGSSALWVENKLRQAMAFWSTCAYLIHRDRLRPLVAPVARRVGDKVHLKIVAGIDKPCRPKYTACCKPVPGTHSFEFQHTSPCFVAPKGLQADSFVYAMAKTYVSAVPLITNGQGGNESTFHQDHVEGIHQSAFRRQRQYMNRLIAGEVARPAFVGAACAQPLPVLMQLVRRPICPLPTYFSIAGQPPIPESLSVHSITRAPRAAMNLSTALSAALQLHRPIALSEIYVPPDVAEVWETRHCLLDSQEWAAGFVTTDVEGQSTRRRFGGAQLQLQHLRQRGIHHVVTGLCGRKKANQLHDLPRLLTHLRLLHDLAQRRTRPPQAGPVGRYALVTEEGSALLTPFAVDWAALIASAPADFLFLRLYHTDLGVLGRYNDQFLNNASRLWHRNAERVYDEEGPRLYLADLAKLPPLVKSHAAEGGAGATVYEYKVVAGLSSPCVPEGCCRANASSKVLQFEAAPPCVVSPNGLQAERLLWRYGPTYSLGLQAFSAEMTHFQERDLRVQKVYAAHRRYFNQFINLHPSPHPSLVARCDSPVTELS